jgi:glycosyltransferase involved in cell wall biosynthesis
MRLLVVHNFYGSEAPSGENMVYQAEKALLKSRGHSVEEFTRHSDEIRSKGFRGQLRGALATPWSRRSARELRNHVERMRPDVVHVHNTFPLISPSIFHAIGHRAARVLTLHNYRIFCAAAIPMRHGRVCTECLDSRSVLPSLRYGCYRDSRAATVPLAAGVALHRRLGTWSNHVEAFISLTEFQRELLSWSGLPTAKIRVKPNFYPGRPTVIPWQEREPSVVFAGRLTAEKGVSTLIRAWKLWGEEALQLELVGDGELRPDLEQMAAGLPIRFLGQVSGSEAQTRIARARLLVVPSECFEGFPMVIQEAFAFGTPVAVARIGPLPSIVKHGSTGLVFDSANPESLLHEVQTAWKSNGLLERLAQAARVEFEAKYTEDANYRMLMAIYEDAIASTVARKNREWERDEAGSSH